MCACRKIPLRATSCSPVSLILNGEKRGGKAATIQAFPAWGKGTASAGDRVLSYAEQMRRAFPYTTSCLSYHVCPIRPYGAPSPRGEGCDTRIPSSKKVVKLPPYNKAPSTSVGMTGGRRVISHSLSHRLVDPSCAFGAGRLASQEGALMGRLGASLD